MWRTLCVAAIAYGIGIPWLDGYRPAALDAPLQAFYQQVNKAGLEGQRLLSSVNEARATYVKAYMKSAVRQLHGRSDTP